MRSGLCVKLDLAKQKYRPRQAQHPNHGRVEPPRVHIVKAGLGESLEMLVNEKIIEELRELQLHQHEPGQRDQPKQNNARPP